MLIWEQYDTDTYGAEWEQEDKTRLALVKRVRDDHYSIVAGTINELEWSGEAYTLSDGKARAARYLLLVNNCEGKQLDKLKHKL